MGRLSAEERLRFEEHFLDCPICVVHLETLEGLRDGLRELSPPGMPVARAERHAVVRLFRDPRAAALLVAASLVVAVLPSALFLGAFRRTRGELEDARKTTDEMQREKAALARALENERAAKATAAGGGAPLAASVFTLNLTRGAAAKGPGNRIVIQDPRQWVIFLLDRPEPPTFASYRARISTADRRPVADTLTASAASGEMLAVGVPPGLLPPGDYVLALEGVGAGPARDLATYGFRAVVPDK